MKTYFSVFMTIVIGVGAGYMLGEITDPPYREPAVNNTCPATPVPAPAPAPAPAPTQTPVAKPMQPIKLV